MKILDKYIVISFLKIAISTILITTSLMLIIDLFINFQVYTAIKIKQMLHLIFLHTPYSIDLVTPPSLLFSTTYFISSLYSNNEFICFLSAGIAYRRIIRPIIFISIFLTLALFIFNEHVKIPANVKYDNKKIEYQQKDNSTNNDNRNVSLTDKKNNITVRANRYYDDTEELVSITMVTYDDKRAIKNKITAKSAYFDRTDDKWVMENAIVYTFNKEKLILENETFDTLKIPEFSINPIFFRAEGEDIRVLSLKDSKRYLETVKTISRDVYTEKITDFYQRLFSPFTAIIMIFVSLSINLKNKKNVLMFSIISSLALGTVYYASEMGLSLLSRQGVINPLIASLLPIILILFVAIYGSNHVSS